MATLSLSSYGAVRGRLTECRASAKESLLALITDDQRGVRSQRDKMRREKIISAFDAVAKEQTQAVTTGKDLSGTWRMIWTTEKEQLFIIQKAPVFGTQTGDILQVIDVDNLTLNNIITFPPSGAFVVSSSIQIVNNQRVDFQFTGAVLRGANWSFPVPPYGKGWFESVYIDEHIRLAKDIRGDYLMREHHTNGACKM